MFCSSISFAVVVIGPIVTLFSSEKPLEFVGGLNLDSDLSFQLSPPTPIPSISRLASHQARQEGGWFLPQSRGGVERRGGSCPPMGELSINLVPYGRSIRHEHSDSKPFLSPPPPPKSICPRFAPTRCCHQWPVPNARAVPPGRAPLRPAAPATLTTPPAAGGPLRPRTASHPSGTPRPPPAPPAPSGSSGPLPGPSGPLLGPSGPLPGPSGRSGPPHPL